MQNFDYTTRVHGHSFFLEFPGPGAMNNVSNIDWTDQQGFRQGFGVTYRGKRGRDNFFHSSVPVTDGLPVWNPFLNEMATPGAQVIGVAITFQITGPARIFHLALFDGTQRFFVLDRRPSLDIRTDQVFGVPARGVLTGLGISVGVNFDSDDATIQFRGATVRLRTTLFEPSDPRP